MSFRIMRIKLLIFIFLCGLAGSCRRNPENREARTKPNADEMTGLNSYLVQKDREIIGNYIERKHLGMTESPTGLWYLIKSAGSGEYLKDNDRIKMNYRCELIDGTLCYSSDDPGPRTGNNRKDRYRARPQRRAKVTEAGWGGTLYPASLPWTRTCWRWQ